MKISIILPFRERVALFDNMMRSFFENTEDVKSCEMLVMMDDDDPAEIQWEYPKVYRVARSEHFNRDYINPLARRAVGRWVVVINDDAIFAVEGWDVILDARMRQAAESFGDDYILGMPDDGIKPKGKRRFSCFPCVSRQSIQKLGYIFNEKVYMWGSDHYIADIYGRIGRKIDIPEVKILHISHHAGLVPKSDNHDRLALIHEKNSMTQQDVALEAGMIKKFIEEGA